MPQDYINFIITPLMAGVVGYVTNWLAIKMLFRPFKARWYTLGWQGIIPRTRKELAKNVADMVDKKLVTADELEKNLSKPEFRAFVNRKVYSFISKKENGGVNIVRLLISTDAMPIVLKLFSDDNFTFRINEIAGSALRNILRVYCESTTLEELNTAIKGQGSFELVEPVLTPALRAGIDRFFHSGKCVKDLIEIDSALISERIVDMVNPVIRDITSNPATADQLGNFFVEHKDDLRKSTGRFFARLFSTLLREKKLRTYIKNELPKLGEFVTADSGIRSKMTEYIQSRLDALLNKPFQDIFPVPDGTGVEKIIEDTVFMLLQNIDFESVLSSSVDKNKKISKILAESGVDINGIIPENINITQILLKSFMAVGTFNAPKSESESPHQVFSVPAEEFADQVTGWLLDIIKWGAPNFLKVMDVDTVVEDKINSLELFEVEDMLFSFMSEHFKWINILGFIIGFAVGLIQVTAVHIFL